MNLKISRILHAGYLLEDTQTSIAFDPILKTPFSGNCYAFPDVTFETDRIKNLNLDAVFISHIHEDHFCLESLFLLKKTIPVYIYCKSPELISLIKDLGFSTVIQIDLETKLKIGNFVICTHKAVDEIDCIFSIHAGNIHILNVVDSWISEETLCHLLKVKWNLILWPFQTMREIEVLSPSRFTNDSPCLPEEGLQQLKLLSPRYLVPSSCQFIHESWSWYNEFMFPISYQFFQEQMQEVIPETNVQQMLPATSWTITDKELIPISDLEWIQRQSTQSIDYQFTPDLKIPRLEEIACNFPSLNINQSLQIQDFCKNQIKQLFLNTDPDLEPYFYKNRIWNLSIVKQDFTRETYQYLVKGNRIELIPSMQNDPEWCTEILESKLWSALNFGESLTSLYMLINNRIFSDKIENELSKADFLNDPLIRVISNQSQNQYHINQFKKIQEAYNFKIKA